MPQKIIMLENPPPQHRPDASKEAATKAAGAHAAFSNEAAVLLSGGGAASAAAKVVGKAAEGTATKDGAASTKPAEKTGGAKAGQGAESTAKSSGLNFLRAAGDVANSLGVFGRRNNGATPAKTEGDKVGQGPLKQAKPEGAKVDQPKTTDIKTASVEKERHYSYLDPSAHPLIQEKKVVHSTMKEGQKQKSVTQEREETRELSRNRKVPSTMRGERKAVKVEQKVVKEEPVKPSNPNLKTIDFNKENVVTSVLKDVFKLGGAKLGLSKEGEKGQEPHPADIQAKFIFKRGIFDTATGKFELVLRNPVTINPGKDDKDPAVMQLGRKVEPTESTAEKARALIISGKITMHTTSGAPIFPRDWPEYTKKGEIGKITIDRLHPDVPTGITVWKPDGWFSAHLDQLTLPKPEKGHVVMAESSAAKGFSNETRPMDLSLFHIEGQTRDGFHGLSTWISGHMGHSLSIGEPTRGMVAETERKKKQQ